MPLDTVIHAQIRANLSVNPDIGQASWSTDQLSTIVATLKDGTTTGKADRVFADTRQLAASANEDLDLAGSLLSPIGTPAVFAKVKAILLKAAAANVNNVVMKPGATNGFLGPFGAAAHTLAVPPGGCILLVAPGAGWTVTPSTGDLLNVANGGAGSAVTYDLMIVGTSA